MKVRIALHYKGISFDTVDVDPQDRSQLVKVSGQPLTPVLVHGDRVMFDSASILRYLDANFREPQIFSADPGEMREIERWETFARTQLNEPLYIVLRQLMGGQRDAAECERASGLLRERAARLEEQLGKGEWLVGGRMTAADITAAPHVAAGMLSAETARGNAFREFFVQNLQLGEGFERTRDWAGRVMAYDR
jgi:glutathione S-transferase